LQCDKIRKADS